MPFLPIHPPDPYYTIFIGQCLPVYEANVKYAVVSIRGKYLLSEANDFLVALLDGPLPRYEFYFANRPLSVHTMFYFAFPNDPQHAKLRYYKDHFSVLEHISQYEWQVARHDLHHLVKSKANDQQCRGTIFGSIPSDPEDSD